MNKQDFEKYAQTKMFNFNVNPLWEKELIQITGYQPENISAKKILDFGCGDGKYFPHFVRYGFLAKNIYGIEVSRIRIQRCQGIGWKNVFFLDSNQQLPFNNDFFDIINMSEVIEHIPKKLITQSLHEIVRAIKPNGFLVITTPNYPIKRLYDIYDALIGKKWSRLKDDPTHVTHYNSFLLDKLLKGYFRNVIIKPYKYGYLYNKFKNQRFLHKIMALCSEKL